MKGLRFEPLTPARWPDLVRLFGERGACGGCWCMCWRRPRARYIAGKGAGNRRAFRDLVRSSLEQPAQIADHVAFETSACSVDVQEVEKPRHAAGLVEEQDAAQALLSGITGVSVQLRGDDQVRHVDRARRRRVLDDRAGEVPEGGLYGGDRSAVAIKGHAVRLLGPGSSRLAIARTPRPHKDVTEADQGLGERE